MICWESPRNGGTGWVNSRHKTCSRKSPLIGNPAVVDAQSESRNGDEISSPVKRLISSRAKKGSLIVRERNILHMEIHTREDARAFMTFYGTLMEIQARFIGLLAEGRPGALIPNDMLFHDYWTDREIDARFRAACKAVGVSDLDAATMDSISQNRGLLQIRQDVLQTSLRRACDLLTSLTKGGIG